MSIYASRVLCLSSHSIAFNYSLTYFNCNRITPEVVADTKSALISKKKILNLPRSLLKSLWGIMLQPSAYLIRCCRQSKEMNMKNPKYFLISSLLLILSMYGCKKDDNPITPDKLSPYIFGQVNDAQGNPVEGCGVHYIYSMTASSLAKLGKTCPSTTISYSIPARSKVTLKIFRWFTKDSIATLVDDTLNAGTYRATMDMSKITNGIYFYQLKVDTSVQERLMSLLNTDLSALAITDPLVTTNLKGSFSLPYGVLGFGVPMISTSASGPGLTADTVYISHTIQVIICKTGYLTTTKTITIDETNGVNQAFTITK
jgi:hypothetical protein